MKKGAFILEAIDNVIKFLNKEISYEFGSMKHRNRNYSFENELYNFTIELGDKCLNVEKVSDNEFVFSDDENFY
jgi:hypothetical protein